MIFERYINYPIIDLYTHLRSDILKHTKIAKESKIDVVVCIANSKPPMDKFRRQRICGSGRD